MIPVWRPGTAGIPPAAGATEADRHFEAGAAFYAAGRYGDALQAFDLAYELSPTGELRYHQAACLDKLGLRQLAAQRYEAYLAEAPGAPDAEQVRAHVAALREKAREAAEQAFAHGQDAFAKGQWREASIAFAQAYEQLPLPDFLFDHAVALEKMGDRVRAIESYRQVLSMTPDAADAAQLKAHIEALARHRTV
jgi:tetratricopeptide (TPR) repeat protein